MKYNFSLYVCRPGTDSPKFVGSPSCASSLELMDALMSWEHYPQWAGVINAHPLDGSTIFLRPADWFRRKDFMNYDKVIWADPTRLADPEYVEEVIVRFWAMVEGIAPDAVPSEDGGAS